MPQQTTRKLWTGRSSSKIYDWVKEGLKEGTLYVLLLIRAILSRGIAQSPQKFFYGVRIIRGKNRSFQNLIKEMPFHGKYLFFWNQSSANKSFFQKIYFLYIVTDAMNTHKEMRLQNNPLAKYRWILYSG